ncbi:hypothetical protein [Streptomyces kronopolitis]
MAQNDEFREVYAASGAAFVHALQLTITIGAIMAERQVRMREERYRQEQQAEEARARAEAEKIRAERAAAEPLLRAAHQERFWRDLEAHPERLGRTWQAAAEWAGGDPYANFTLQHLKEQLHERYGLDVPDWPVGGAEMARLITLADPAYRQKLETARVAAESAAGTSYAVIVRDRRDADRIVYRGEATADAGMDAAVAAATEYLKWRAEAGAELSADRPDEEFAIELVENTGNNAKAGHVPAAILAGSDAHAVLVEDADRLRSLARGATQPADHAEMLRALKVELERLEQEEKKRTARRDEYLVILDERTDLSAADVRRLNGNVTAITEGLDTLHQQQADTALRIAATVAEMAGENPQHVYDTARLRDSLDDGWWETASTDEIGKLWGHVEGWDAGAARDQMREQLRERVEHHHGLLIPKDARAEMVAALFGGSDAPGPALKLTEQSEALRAQAEALFEDSFDRFATAAELDSQGPEKTEEARSARERAELDGRLGRVLVEQAAWLEDQAPTVLSQLYTENSAEPLQNLRAEFERRWGHETPPAAVEKISELQAVKESGVWQVWATPGDASPSAIPGQATTAREQSESPTSPPAAAPAVEGEAAEHQRQEAERARRTEAASVRETVDDAEAVEAVRLADMGFPEGPEAAVAVAAKTRGGNSAGATPGRQRDVTLER